MSTMLATSNPEAVAEIDPTRDRRVPYQGQSLVYHCRPGEGRGGKITAVALCTRVEDDDHVELLIIYAADDFITKWKIPRKTDQNNVNSWSFNDYDEEHYQPGSAKLPVVTEDGQMTWEDVKQMYKEIGELRTSIAQCREKLEWKKLNEMFARISELEGKSKLKSVKGKKPEIVSDESADD